MVLTVKEYLKQAFTINKLIKARESQIADIRDKLSYISPIPQVDRVQSSPMPDKMAELVAELADAKSAYCDDVKRLSDMKAEIKQVIDKIDDPVHYLIMFERYVNLKRWDDIATYISYIEFDLSPISNFRVNSITLVRNRDRWVGTASSAPWYPQGTVGVSFAIRSYLMINNNNPSAVERNTVINQNISLQDSRISITLERVASGSIRNNITHMIPLDNLPHNRIGIMLEPVIANMWEFNWDFNPHLEIDYTLMPPTAINLYRSRAARSALPPLVR